jgi:hypothetical protein
VAGNGYLAKTVGRGGYSGDGGPATLAELAGPSDMAVDTLGNLYIADEENNVISEVTNGSPLVVNGLSNNIDVSVYPVPNDGNFQLRIKNYGLRVENIDIYNVL